MFCAITTWLRWNIDQRQQYDAVFSSIKKRAEARFHLCWKESALLMSTTFQGIRHTLDGVLGVTEHQ